MSSQKCEPGGGTATQRLASVLLGQDVRQFIAERRDVECPRPWRFIARDLHEATGGQVDVTYETVRSWHEGTAS